MQVDRTLVFCRAPVAGRVKTRLAGSLGAQAAADLQRELAERLLGGLAPETTEIWCDPDASHPFFQELGGRGFALHRQRGADLGERMAGALAASLGRGDTASATLVGTDCPPIDAAYIARAPAALRHCDLVLGPAEDGGYGLIAMRRPLPVFAGIGWGGPQVLAQTCRLLRQARLRYRLLPMIWDLDRPADYRRYLRWKAAAAAGRRPG